MAILPIKIYPDPILKLVSKPILDINSEIQKIIDDMIETLYDISGLGLAAPQIGVSLRLFVFDLSKHNQALPLTVVINPEILHSEGELSDTEGCLSLPEHFMKVVRPKKIRIKGLDRDGKTVEIEGEDLTARLFQHEVDHLNGLLLINRISVLKKNLLIKKIRKKTKLQSS